MAAYGIVADIHGNLEAFRAVLAALERRGVDRIVCLGDIVGYNANPNECAEIVQRRPIDSIAGNHDLISIGRLGFRNCANKAAYSLKRTRLQLSPETRIFLGSLAPSRTYEGSLLMVHGSVLDVEQYLRTHVQIRENAEALRQGHSGIRVCFFGHTHEPRIYAVDEGTVEELQRGSICQLTGAKIHFINPGSVDAARKREHKMAEFGVFDSTRLSMEFHRVPYDHDSAEAKALSQGYRIDRVTNWLYSAGRKIRRALDEEHHDNDRAKH